eukprot:g26454.t1
MANDVDRSTIIRHCLHLYSRRHAQTNFCAHLFTREWYKGTFWDLLIQDGCPECYDKIDQNFLIDLSIASLRVLVQPKSCLGFKVYRIESEQKEQNRLVCVKAALEVEGVTGLEGAALPAWSRDHTRSYTRS